MAEGYLVALGDGALNTGDTMATLPVTFTSARSLGPGQWRWSGTDGGRSYSNAVEPGEYLQTSDGSVYFVPAWPMPANVLLAQALNPPSFPELGGKLSGTEGDDVIDADYDT
jgi:hypothetical protein